MSVDLEQDISKFLKDSYLGVENGIPLFLETLKSFQIKADFFVTGDICQKYPDIIHKILDDGHTLGCHGLDHSIDYYCMQSYSKQHKDIAEATAMIENTVGIRPSIFRTPNFSADGNTIKSLEELEYKIDSSVLPGRVMKKWRILPILNFSKAPRVTYNPSYEDITKKGNSSVLEVPITENPKYPGSPIGTGFLNLHGIPDTLSIIEKVSSPYVIFLIHPWELVNLGNHYPDLRDWIKKSCKNDFESLSKFLKILNERFSYSSVVQEAHLNETQ